MVGKVEEMRGRECEKVRWMGKKAEDLGRVREVVREGVGVEWLDG